MSTAIKLNYEPIRSLGFGSIVAGYTAIGTALVKPAVIFSIQNLTDKQLMFSFDGVNDHFTLSPNGVYNVDCNANKSDRSGALYLPEGTIIYVKRVGTPTTGAVYVTVGYQGV